MVVTGAMLALLVVSINQTVLTTALPRIIGELGGLGMLSWLFTSYMLTATLVVPVIGKLSDLYGRKPFIIAGIILFSAASALSGLSQSMLQLVLFRGLQGIGGGMVFANCFAIIGDIFPPAERGKWQGLTAAIFGLSSVIGPTVGGTITDHLSWRWVFYVNIPVAVLALIVLWGWFPWVRRRVDQHSIDYLGVTALTVFVVPLLLALVWAGDLYPWFSAQFALLLALSGLGLAMFLKVESTTKEPIMPLGLFRIRPFAVANMSNFLRGMSMIGVVSFIPLYMQGVLGQSATNSGIVVMPMMMGLVVGSTITGQIVSRTGLYRLPLVIAGGLLCVGLFLLSRMDENTSNAIAIQNMIITGFGLGIGMPVLNLALQNSVPYRHLGVASSASPFFFQIGGTLAVAVSGTLLNTHVRDNLEKGLPPDALAATPPQLLPLIEDPQTLLNPGMLARLQGGFQSIGPDGPRLFGEVTEAMRLALSEALVVVFFLAFVISLASFAVGFLMPDVAQRGLVEEPGAARATASSGFDDGASAETIARPVGDPLGRRPA